MCFEKIRDLILDIAGCSEDEVQMETNLKADLDLDSLDAMELAISIEEELGVAIPEDKIGELECVKDIVEFVDSNSGE